MAKRYKELDDGRIQLFISHGSGKERIQKSKIVPGIKGRKREREKAIELLLDDFEKEVIQSEKDTGMPTLGEYVNQWFALHKVDIAATTYDSYKSRYKNHLEEALGHIRLDKLTPAQVTKLKVDLLEKLQPRTVKDIIDFLQMIMNDAAENDVIIKNQINKVKPPIVPKKEKKVFSETELSKVVSYIQAEPLIRQCVFFLALFSGLRRSEIVGLNNDSIVPSSNGIVVSRAYVRSSAGPILKETKSNKIRKVVAPDFVIGKILQLQEDKELLPKRIDKEHKDALFIQLDGKRLYPTTPTLWWNNFLKKHKDLPHVTFHGLRHTYASLLISNELDLVTISNLIGHSKTSTTTDIYGHMIKNKSEEVLEIIDATLENKGEKMQNKCKIVNIEKAK